MRVDTPQTLPSPPHPPVPQAPETPSKPRGRRIAVGVAVLAAFVVAYSLSLFGFHELAKSSGTIKPNLNPADDTIVLIRLEELRTAADRLTVNVLVIPQDDMVDKRLDVLTTDTAVRMDPPNDLGDLFYPAGKRTAQVATTIAARGDINNWPFDSYTTETLSAQALVGTGDARQFKPTRVEVTGELEGWDYNVRHVGGPGQVPGEADNAIITLRRAPAPLMFDLGILLVLFALPTVAFAVVFPMLLRKRKFVPAFGTWLAAMLFAVIPIRNFLPGAPPPGAWIDQALVIWVLIALIAAMVVYTTSWYREPD